MTKNEFITYLDYLNKLFKVEKPDKTVMEAWYKPFEKVNLHIAKKMADMYFQQETGKFKLSKLIEYKSKAMAGCTYKVQEGICPLCKNTGYIQIEVPYKTSYTTKCKRCICAIGNSLPKNIRQATEEELKGLDANGSIIRDLRLHHDLDEENEGTDLDKYFGKTGVFEKVGV